MSNLLASNLLTKKVSRLLMSNLLIDTWTGLISHVKAEALTCSIEHANGQGHVSTFTYQNSYLKSTHFTSYRGKRT